MCYDIKTSLEAQLRRARFRGDEAAVRELEEKISPFVEPKFYHASGYLHPRILIYTNRQPYVPVPAVWGLIPHWVKDRQQQKKLWNGTLNARAETLWQRPAFREAARQRRCLIYLEGFYEHHHRGGKTFPFFISRKDGQSFAVAGLWDEWADPETGEVITSFTIITTRANALLARIHNNPKLAEPRMPVILAADNEDTWLAAADPATQQALLQPYPGDELTAWPVAPLRGKQYPGNVPAVNKPVKYEELAGMFD